MEAVSELTGQVEIKTAYYKDVSNGFTKFAEDDLIWAKITPCMQNGKSAIVKGLIDGVGFGSTEFHVIRPKNDSINIEFIKEILTLTDVLNAFQGAFTGSAGQQRVPADFLAEFIFPIPLRKVQDEIVDKLKLARKKKLFKENFAEELLKGLDELCLENVGIRHVKDYEGKKVFCSFHKGIRKRMDVDYSSPKFIFISKEIENGKFQALPISQLCSAIRSGFAAGKQAQSFDLTNGIPHLRPLNVNIFGELSLKNTKRIPAESINENDLCNGGDVLFNNTNSTALVGKTALFDLTEPCATSNHITRLIVNNLIQPGYLVLILNALRSLGYFGMLSTNFNNQAGINVVTLSNVKIPCPPIAVQIKIVNEVTRLKSEASKLKTEAETEWQKAKQWFEEQLLGKTNASKL